MTEDSRPEDVQSDENSNKGEMNFLSHLLELRDRLLRIMLVVIAIFLSLFYFANDIYTYLAGPLTSHLPEGSMMIATGVASTFLIPFKLTLILSVFTAMPFILYQVWGFVAPGLYRHERKIAIPVLMASSFLFYLGMFFAYYVVFPLVFNFFASATPESITYTPDIGSYLDIVLTLFFAFGVAFEVPIATVLLVWSGTTTADKLAAKRPYVVLGAFVIGMLLTPPDVISQTLLALPMWVLFEIGILFARIYIPKKSDEESRTTESTDANKQQKDDAVSDYKPMNEEELEAEFNRVDKEMKDLDRP
jgi:sec-independent protein translocase protein TatC